MRMLPSEQQELQERGAKIEFGWGPLRVEQGAMVFARCTATHDAKGRFGPTLDGTDTCSVPFDQLVYAVGQQAEPALATHLQNTLDQPVPLAVDTETQRVPGRETLYAGGDIVRGAGTIVEAVGDGRRAARAIDAALAAR